MHDGSSGEDRGGISRRGLLRVALGCGALALAGCATAKAAQATGGPTGPDKGKPPCEKFAYRIDAKACVACGSCEPECPQGAIAQSDAGYVIDEKACTRCGSCVQVCPVDCIVKTPTC